jgi:glucose-6-phosphate isomerase
VRFAANVDPHDLERALEGAEPSSTLFVVVSKTFTTQETMANAERVHARSAPGIFVAITANTAGRQGVRRERGAADVGLGRAGASRCGRRWASPRPCSIGWQGFEDFLRGANEIDRHFAETPLEKNVPVLMALIGVWNTNFLGAPTHAVLPYSNALRLLPAYLQQLEMESNGKRVDREGRPVDYATAPILWGAEGTVSQHSFHQLLHQGTHSVPADFIDLGLEKNLSANCRAQADALAFGTDDPPRRPTSQYPGNRPVELFHSRGRESA